MNLNPLVHKITIGIVLVTMFFTFFGKFLPFSEDLKVAIVGFIGALGAFVKTFQTPPVKDDSPKDPPPGAGTVTRIIGGLSLVFLALLLPACVSPQKPAACAPDTFLAEESGRFQASVLAACDRAVPLSHCPAYPALKADHDARLEGWIESCRK